MRQQTRLVCLKENTLEMGVAFSKQIDKINIGKKIVITRNNTIFYISNLNSQ